jgi:hypothetical protein
VKFPNQLQNRAAATIASTAKLVNTAHQRLNTLGSQVSALTPGSWELLTLSGGWSNVAGYIPAQVRIFQAGQAQIVGHIQGGTTTDGTVIGALTAGYYNPTHAHSFTANVLAGASAVATAGTLASGMSAAATDNAGLPDGTINGTSQTDGLPDGTINGTSASASGSGSHSHGAGSYAVTNGVHSHGPGSFAVTNGVHDHTLGTVTASTPVSYNSAMLTLDTSGNLTLHNCPAAATQLSFSESLPLVTG